MSVFAEVAKQGSFASAARALKLSTTSVSRQVSELETWLGVTLMRRTTRKLSLTDEGSYYLSECQQVVDDIARIRATAQDAPIEPSGTLRLTAPAFVVKECIQPIIPDFLRAYPGVRVELSTADRFIDLVEEGFDLALRVGDLPDSSLVARRLGDIQLVVIAAPDYIACSGKPKTPADLKGHNCIVDTVASFGNRWPMKHRGKRQKIAVEGNVTVNNGEVARNLATQGIGLALLPHFFVANQLASGELLEVLKGQVDNQVGFYVIYPHSRHITPRVRAFIDFIVDYFEQMKR
ncbi:MAG: LysR family transcriptional regulator [Pseudomonadota bacterium]